MDSLYIALDDPRYDRDDLPYLRTMLDVVNASVAERWARTSAEPLPAYRLWVEAADSGVVCGYRRRDATPWSDCAVLEFVRAALRFVLDLRPEEPAAVRLGARAAHLPCGSYPGAALLESLWFQTGADVPGESATYACPCGARHAVLITE